MNAADRAAFGYVEEAVRLSRYGGDCYSYCMLAAGHLDLATVQPHQLLEGMLLASYALRVRVALAGLNRVAVDAVVAARPGGPRGLALEPGRHRLELHHDAYFSHYQVLDLAPAQRLRLPIALAPILP